ncbi:diguanylate cyclase [Hyphomonas sp.]|uniref:diguanylate cyclase n=1 Tax=Hyphomonas sp. TaxID=87 RepID=UPI0035278785
MAETNQNSDTDDFARVSPGDIRNAISVLEQALFNHVHWTDALNTTLICDLQPDARDLEADAHRNCRFGQWYYNPGTKVVQSNPNFLELEKAHQSMHETAAHLLNLLQSHQTIPMADYERFNSDLKEMRLLIETLKRELEDEIYNVDALTGASSRVGMLTKLREQHELVRRKLESCVIVMMDIDRFKLVNDKYGHLVGDRALAEFAHHVMRHTRPFDRLFRYGGEEFLLCVPHTDINTAFNLVERIRSELAEKTIEVDGFPPFSITSSFGMTLLDPDATLADCIERADQATYAAKERGRNMTVVWDPSMERRLAS